jgi:hypothetical protein
MLRAWRTVVRFRCRANVPSQGMGSQQTARPRVCARHLTPPAGLFCVGRSEGGFFNRGAGAGQLLLRRNGSLPMRILLVTLVLCLITSCADAKSKQITGKKVLMPSHRAGLIVGRSEGGYIILTEPRLKGRVPY